MDASIVRMFNCAIKQDKARCQAVAYSEILGLSLQAGYLIDPQCATEDVLDFLKEENFNPNSTFYKTWEDIKSRTRVELLYDQLLHYFTAYLSQAIPELEIPVFTQNDNPIRIKPENYKIIKAVDPEEIRDKIVSILESGVALNIRTQEVFIDFLKEYSMLNSIDVNKIKNREVQATIAYITKKYPTKDEFALLRCIHYAYTKSALLIKSKENIEMIRNRTWGMFHFNNLSQDQIILLSRIFYRYKPIFLAMKTGNSMYINRIRRLAKKNHNPLQPGFWESCLNLRNCNQAASILKAVKEVENLDNFHKIRIMQAIKERLVENPTQSRMFHVRNGKLYIKTNCEYLTNADYYQALYTILEESVVESLKKKATTFVSSPRVHITAPSTEKNFIGNYPLGTYVD